jgi:RNA polymerase sigma factor (sigma-70 family)
MDRAVVERARGGDSEAFAALADASSGWAFSVATLILRDEDRAKDAVQEALIAAWRGIRALREPDAWDAWLRQLVVRACYRLASRDRGRIVELRVDTPGEPVHEDSSRTLAMRDELERGFRRLPVDQRAVVVLHYYLGLQLTEVAETLGIPDGTARSRLHRATATLRTALEADARESFPAQERST